MFNSIDYEATYFADTDADAGLACFVHFDLNFKYKFADNSINKCNK